MTQQRTRHVWGIAIAFATSTVASISLTIVYALGGQPQLEGTLLGISLGGIAVGLVGWAKSLMPNENIVEDKLMEPGDEEPTEAAEATFDYWSGTIERRKFLGRVLAASAVALGAAAVFPIRSLGVRPGRSLYRTRWRAGSHVVTAMGDRVRADAVPVDGFLTVFPEGATDAADSQAVLIRLSEDAADRLPRGGIEAPEGFVVYSKICTHTGCPVGLYQAETRELFCPCHQSAFDVLREAVPTSGPATRPLPRLPVRIADGFLVATGDFNEPVGPTFWGLP